MGIPRFLTAAVIVAAALLLLLVVPSRSAPPGDAPVTPDGSSQKEAGGR